MTDKKPDIGGLKGIIGFEGHQVHAILKDFSDLHPERVEFRGTSASGKLIVRINNPGPK